MASVAIGSPIGNLSEFGYSLGLCSLTLSSTMIALKRTQRESRVASNARYGWYVVGTTMVNQSLAMGILLAGFALFVVPWMEQFGAQRSEVLLGSTLILVVNSLLSPVAGRLMDSVSIRTLILTGITALCSGLVLIATAKSLWVVLLAYATLFPLSIVLCGALSSQTLVSRWFVEGRGMALGISSLGSSLGGFLLPVIIATLIASYSWQSTALLLSVACLILMLPLNALVLRRSPLSTGSHLEGNSEHNVSSVTAEPVWSMSQVLKKPMFWIPVAGIIPLMAAFTGIQFNLGAYMGDLGYDQGLAAQLIMIIAGGQVGGKLIVGAVGDRMDHRHVYWVMAVMTAVAIYLFSGGPSQVSLYAAAAILGLSVGATLPLLPIVYASRFGTRSLGTVLGLVNLVLIVGSFGSLFAGTIYDSTQSYDLAFLVFALLLLPVSIAMYFLPSPERARADW